MLKISKNKTLNSKNEILDDLMHFIAIVQAGSLNKAAAQNNVSTATLTRRLQKLENHLGCRLLHRSPRGIKLTLEGETYLEHCQPQLASLQQTLQDIQNDMTEPSGLVRVLAPTNLAVMVLSDFWRDFLLRYPLIQLDLHLDNRNEDLLQQGADLALRVGEQSRSNYMQRHLAKVTMGIFASADYLARQPKITKPADLYEQEWLIARPLSCFTLTKGDEQVEIRLQTHKIQVNEISLCVQLASQGLGLCYVPRLYTPEVANGKLLAVLPDWQLPTRNIYAIWQTQKKLPARVRVLVDELIVFMKEKKVVLGIP